MNKKLWLGFIAVFITAEILNFLVMGLILGPSMMSLQNVWRPDMMSLLWIIHVTMLIGSFFFVFIFSKGYEGKGIAEGIRYGLYIGIWMSLGMAYATYATVAIPVSLAHEWFILGVVDYIIQGIVVAWIYGIKPKAAAS
jgi:hypothetical protein